MTARGVCQAIALLLLTVSLAGFVTGALCLFVARSPRDVEASQIFVEYFGLCSAFLLPVILAFRRGFEITIPEAFLVVALSWLLIPALSIYPYVATAALDPLDAYFEALSGFSGTGLTMIAKPEDMPMVVLLWRALTQWMGELGVVVFAGTLLPKIHRTIRSVYIVERGERIAPTIVMTMRKLLAIYVLYTAIGTILFMLGGMDPFNALTHTMTAIATGGMSTSSGSIGTWIGTSNHFLYTSSIVIMVLGALNFADHDLLLKGRIRSFLSSTEVRWFFIFLAIFATMLGIYAYLSNDMDRMYIWFYHLVSGYTTTGFQLTSSTEIEHDPDFVKVVLILSMIVGGATFSTAGGVKIRRAAIAFKALVWNCARTFAPPTMVMGFRVGRESLEEREVLAVLSFIMTYLLTLTILTLVVHVSLVISGFTGFSFVDALFETTSAMSCVGLSVGITSTSTPLATKVALMVAMYLGRLEFAPLYLAIGYSYVSKVSL